MLMYIIVCGSVLYVAQHIFWDINILSKLLYIHAYGSFLIFLFVYRAHNM